MSRSTSARSQSTSSPPQQPDNHGPPPTTRSGMRSGLAFRCADGRRSGAGETRSGATDRAGRPTAQVQRVGRDSSRRWACACPPRHYGISPRASQPDGPSSCPDPHYTGVDRHYPRVEPPARLSDTDRVAAGPGARVVEQKGVGEISVYRVTEVIGTSTESWEAAARSAVETAAATVRELRVAEVVRQDVTIENGNVTTFRVRLEISFKYASES